METEIVLLLHGLNRLLKVSGSIYRRAELDPLCFLLL